MQQELWSHRIKRGIVPFRETSETLPPARGFVPAHNRRRARWDAVDLKRWLRYNRLHLKTLKIDVFDGLPSESSFEELLDYARDIDLRLSLRITCESPPCDLIRLREQGLLDVYLTPRPTDSPHFRAWLDGCRAAAIPVRLQLLPPWRHSGDPESSARILVDSGVVAVTLAMNDRVLDQFHAERAVPAEEWAHLNRFAKTLVDAGIEMVFVGVPEMNIEPAIRTFMISQRVEGMDVHTYDARSLDWALQFYEKRRNAARIALVITLAGETSRLNKVDNLVIQFLLHKREWLLEKVLFWHKLTRFHPRLRGAPHALGDWHSPPLWRGLLTASLLRPKVSGLSAPLASSGSSGKSTTEDAPARIRYIDEVDVARLEHFERTQALAREALHFTTNRPPDLELGPEYCHAANGHTEPIPGALRWYGAANVEKLSTECGPFRAPFAVSYTVGGGNAEYLGFAVGKYGRAVCSMTDTSHTLTLFVETGGRWVLLRDGRPVSPVEFDGPCYVPTLFPDQCRIRLSLWNIDGTIVTQSPRVWVQECLPEAPRCAVRYSVVIVCSRYARRLQAALLALVQQRNFDVSNLEVLVAYVPALDATEDVLDSVQAACPALSIRRFPFEERLQTAKGLMINEAVAGAAGEWVVLLDADILVPSRFFAAIDATEPGCHFIAPDGRKMLDRDTTARILLGQIDPYACWDWLMSGPGEFRYREAQNMPIGYCQVVRRICFDTVRYPEYPHFEGADWVFAQDLRKAFGSEKRLDGVAVLHLDHGASQWYGARRHF